MVSSFPLLVLLVSNFGAFAQTFPEGCILDNMAKVCQSLSQINPHDTLQFADGSSVPACVIRTENVSALIADHNGESKSTKLASLTRKYFDILQKDSSLSDQRIAELLRSPARLETYLKKHRYSLKSKDWLDYQPLAKERQVQNAVTTKYTDLQPGFDFAKKILLDLGGQQLAADSSSDKNSFNGLKNVQLHRTGIPENLLCRPMLNSFYYGPNGMLKNSVYFTEGTTQLNEKSIYFLTGHELGHSFDPCHALVDPISEVHPYRKLISCLRNDVGHFKSVTKIKSHADWCKDDHTNEAFSDYFGLYVLEEYLKKNPTKTQKIASRAGIVAMPPGYENLFFLIDDACAGGIDDDDSKSDHPSGYRRLKNVITNSSIIAKSLGCNLPTNTPRCDIRTGLTGYAGPATGDKNTRLKGTR